ncbi:MAG: phosphoglycolate phosphatase [Gemmatimonadaceae bacterium]|nr:phosphoglycolate phosphatase [Gemmatimonadaceae bacterium]
MSNNRDAFTADGANKLAKRIMAHWWGLGYDVDVWAEPVRVPLRHRDQLVYQVRSDMVNGMPVRRMAAVKGL